MRGSPLGRGESSTVSVAGPGGLLFTRMTYKRTGSVRSTWRGARTVTTPPSAAEVLARANMECNDICGEPGSSEALNKCLPPSPFPESDISPAFKNQICAIPVNLRSNKEHVSLLQNLSPPRSSSKRPSAITQPGDRRPPQHLVPGPPSAPAAQRGPPAH